MSMPSKLSLKLIVPVLVILASFFLYQVITATAPKANAWGGPPASAQASAKPSGSNQQSDSADSNAEVSKKTDTSTDTGTSKTSNQQEQYTQGKQTSNRSRTFGKTSAATVSALTLESGSYTPEITLYGKVKSYQQQWLAAPFSTDVKSLLVNAGDRVQAGQTLVVLNAEDLKSQVKQLQARVENSQAGIRLEKLRQEGDIKALEIDKELLRIAKLSLQRYENLSSQQLTSSNDYETALKNYQTQLLNVQNREFSIAKHEDSLTQMEAQTREAASQLEEAERQLSEAKVIAPFDGVIGQINVELGESVTANQELVLVFDETRMGLETKVPLRWASSLWKADGVTAQANGYELTMTDLDSVANNGVIAARFKFENQTYEALGKHLQIRVALPVLEDVYSVPASSLYENRVIYRIEDGLLKAVPVELQGQLTNNGDTWALVASNDLSSGQQVLVTRLPNAATGLQVRALGGL